MATESSQTLASLYVVRLYMRVMTSQYACLQCDDCFYCRRGQAVLCENFNARGVTLDGGFAEYIV